VKVGGALSWSFEERDASRVDALLRALLEDTGARHALLIDRTGQVLTLVGSTPDFDAAAFASLAAADFAANDQIASMLGESAFASLSHQGAAESVHLSGVAGRAILAVVFDHSVTLGLVRIRVKRAIPELTGLVEELHARPPAAPPAHFDGWAAEAQVEVDRLFEG
jgi:predicted regulator of Ras-like GTPase activity (Roadblock/LC7/MglB family)